MGYKLGSLFIFTFFISCNSFKFKRDTENYFVTHYKALFLARCYDKIKTDEELFNTIPCIMPWAFDSTAFFEIDSMSNLVIKNVYIHMDSAGENRLHIGSWSPDYFCIALEINKLSSTHEFHVLSNNFRNRMTRLKKKY